MIFEKLLYLLFDFIIYSVVGWILESIYRSFVEKKIVNSGFMYGPYCPIYGLGAIIMILVLKYLKSNITILFIASMVLLTLLEYIAAILLEKIYHTKYWDYADEKINFQGRICLKNSIYWGILGVLFTLVINPFIENFINNISIDKLIYLDLVTTIIIVTDFIINNIKTLNISKRMTELKMLKNKIALQILEMKNNKKSILSERNRELKKLQIKYNRLNNKLKKQIIRIKSAFPTIKSDTINKFFTKKIKIKNKIKKSENVIKIIRKDK